MSSDAIRNSVEITLAGQKRTLRATFETMLAIERDLGKPWAVLGRMVVDGDYGFAEVTTIVHNGLRGAEDHRLSFDQVGNAILETGLNTLRDSIILFVSIGFQGVKPLGKQERAPETAA